MWCEHILCPEGLLEFAYAREQWLTCQSKFKLFGNQLAPGDFSPERAWSQLLPGWFFCRTFAGEKVHESMWTPLDAQPESSASSPAMLFSVYVCIARGSGSRHCQLSGWRTRFWFPVANCRVSLQKKILLLCIILGFLGAADMATSLILLCLFQKFSRYFRNGHQKKHLL